MGHVSVCPCGRIAAVNRSRGRKFRCIIVEDQSQGQHERNNKNKQRSIVAAIVAARRGTSHCPRPRRWQQQQRCARTTAGASGRLDAGREIESVDGRFVLVVAVRTWFTGFDIVRRSTWGAQATARSIFHVVVARHLFSHSGRVGVQLGQRSLVPHRSSPATRMRLVRRARAARSGH
jgi:hypothetical protein